jgi:hypothetical protein
LKLLIENKLKFEILEKGKKKKIKNKKKGKKNKK